MALYTFQGNGKQRFDDLGFFDLPAEVRNVIYDHAAAEDIWVKFGAIPIPQARGSTTIIANTGQPTIFRASRQARDEGLGIFYCKTLKFQFIGMDGTVEPVLRYLQSIDRYCRNSIRRITLETLDHDIQSLEQLEIWTAKMVTCLLAVDDLIPLDAEIKYCGNIIHLVQLLTILPEWNTPREATFRIPRVTRQKVLPLPDGKDKWYPHLMELLQGEHNCESYKMELTFHRKNP